MKLIPQSFGFTQDKLVRNDKRGWPQGITNIECRIEKWMADRAESK